MSAASALTSFKRLGTGLAFVAFPLVFVFAFAVHSCPLHPYIPGLLERIDRAPMAGSGVVHPVNTRGCTITTVTPHRVHTTRT